MFIKADFNKILNPSSKYYNQKHKKTFYGKMLQNYYFKNINKNILKMICIKNYNKYKIKNKQ